MYDIELLPEEEWKDIPGYEGLYKISNMGRILDVITGSLLNMDKSYCVILHKNNEKHQKSVKTLVFNLFVEDSHGRMLSNINGDKTDNRYTNIDYTYKTTGHKIGDSVGLHYTIVNKDLTKNEDVYYYRYKLQCNKCYTECDAVGVAVSYKTHKCKCYSPPDVGDIILDKYIILSRTRDIYKHYRYDVQCTVCKDIIYGAYALTGKKQLTCSCLKNRKYKIGEIYNGYKLIDKRTVKGHNNGHKYINGSAEYLLECMDCHDTRWCQSNSLTRYKGFKCTCKQSRKAFTDNDIGPYKIGDIVLDHYKVIRVISNTGHGYRYDLQCLNCKDIVKSRSLYDYKDKNRNKFKCSCYFPTLKVGDIIFNKYEVTEINGARYLIRCVHCGKYPKSPWRSYHDIRENGQCDCYTTYNKGKGIQGLELKACNRFYTIRDRCYNENLKNTNPNAYSLYVQNPNIFICKYWLDDKERFIKWFIKELKIAKDRYPNYSWKCNKDGKRVYREVRWHVDRIDNRFEYSPPNCQILPDYLNSKKVKYDRDRTQEQLDSDYLAYVLRWKQFIKKEKLRKDDLDAVHQSI